MPYLLVQSNHDIEHGVLSILSRRLAELLGKSERYVMTALEAPVAMTFAGSEDDPAAFLQIKSIGLPKDDVPEISRTLCDLLEREGGIPSGHIYIEFVDVEREMWGHHEGTF